MISCFNCPIKDVRLQPTLRLHSVIVQTEIVVSKQWNTIPYLLRKERRWTLLKRDRSKISTFRKSYFVKIDMKIKERLFKCCWIRKISSHFLERKFRRRDKSLTFLDNKTATKKEAKNEERKKSNTLTDLRFT